VAHQNFTEVEDMETELYLVFLEWLLVYWRLIRSSLEQMESHLLHWGNSSWLLVVLHLPEIPYFTAAKCFIPILNNFSSATII
jgi:hypothetical protein